MIDLEEELGVPIMFYEMIEYIEGEFTLVHNNIPYKFVLKMDKILFIFLCTKLGKFHRII